MHEYGALEKIYTNNIVDHFEIEGVVEDFFCNCYRLKDWLIKDKTVALSKLEVDRFINNSTYLKYAADFCNAFKHGGLDHSRKPRSGDIFHDTTSYIAVNVSPDAVVAKHGLNVAFGNETFDAFIFATDCIKEWDMFLQSEAIVL